jgi:hypothetical protein
VPAKPKFTRIPKVEELVGSGVPAEAISTYCALTDYANNKTGLCWPKMRPVLAQDGDPRQDPWPLGTHDSKASAFTKRAWANRVHRTKKEQGEVLKLPLPGASYRAHHCAHHYHHHRTREAIGEARP